MSVHTQIYPRAALRTEAPTATLAPPIAAESSLTWLCSFCGLLRTFEGGRPLGLGHQNDCRECGGRLAAKPEDWAAIAKCDTRPGSVRGLIDRGLF
jgi:hypothetical protein